MALNLHHLRLFTAVVDYGGFTKAAAALDLSQPAISKSLNELERQLHLQLLRRDGRSTALTPAGRLLYSRARELFGVERTAEQELRELRGLKRGLLRIGASATISNYMLPAILGRFHLRHPRVGVRVSTANTRTVVRMLLESRVDVGLVEGPVADARIEARPWRDDALIVAAPPDHPLVEQQPVEPRALAGQTFLVREHGSGTRTITTRALARHGVRLHDTMRIGGTAAIKQAVAAGLGLAFVSRAAAADQLALGRIVPLEVRGLEIRRTFTELRVRGRPVSGPALELQELLADAGDDSAAGETSHDASGIA
ncbi:MAG TPA: LysR substrate-binding domain-containing protein [Gemmatimonadaceae bacterium]|nr:LysR substrate-binding domain-containing protein [Gemmatimonadaceae bacterium]